MALIRCGECGHEVSSMASRCPNCGYSTHSTCENCRYCSCDQIPWCDVRNISVDLNQRSCLQFKREEPLWQYF